MERGGTPEKSAVPASQVEQLIQELVGIEAARLVLDDWGAIREVHVLADSSRAPKAVVRDVLSALQARWGLVIDHRRISVAQLEGTPPRPKWVRLRLKQLSVTTDPVRAWTEVVVTLAPVPPRDLFGRAVHDPEIPEGEWQGRAAGAAGAEAGSLRLAAEAALQALNQSLRAEHSFTLVDVGRVVLGNHEVVVCLLNHHAPRGAVNLLAGTAPVRRGPVDAAVRAALNATNRSFGLAVRRKFPHSKDGTGADWVEDVAAGADPESWSEAGEEH